MARKRKRQQPLESGSDDASDPKRIQLIVEGESQEVKPEPDADATNGSISEQTPEESNGKRFKCPQCGKGYKYQRTLHEHLNVHAEKFKCVVCQPPKCFASKKDLAKHETTHVVKEPLKKRPQEEKPYKCPVCGRGYESKMTLGAHLNVHKEKFKCDVCNKCCSDKRDLARHKVTHVEKTPLKARRAAEEKPFKCIKCGKGFQLERSLRRHKHIHLGTYKCELCDKPKCFGSERELTIHYASHSDEKTFNCDLCSKRFKYARGLQGHKHVHLGTYKCSLCNPPKCFPTSQDLAEHASSHSDDKPFKCDECSSSFKTMKQLRMHKPIHRKGFQCPTCDRRCSTRSQLARHSAVHTGIRSFLCHSCPKQFFSVCVLRRHLETHQPGYVTQVPCDICGFKFKSLMTLTAHKKIHAEGNHRHCKYCSRGFATDFRLKEHLDAAHRPSKKFQCNQCPAKFAHEYGLNYHKKRVHGAKLSCNYCGKVYTDSSTLRRHKIIHHHETRNRERRFINHECLLCTPHLKFPNATSLSLHRIYNHPDYLSPTEDKNPHELVGAADEKVYFGTDQDIQRYVQETKDYYFNCVQCGSHFTGAGFFEEHLKVYHHLANRQVNVSDIKSSFELVARCNKVENVNALFKLSKRLVEQHDRISKIYKLFFIPISIKRADIKKEIEAGNKRILVYNGKLSQHFGGQAISLHHTNDKSNPVSTNALMAIANKDEPTYYCLHVSDVWTPRDKSLTSGNSISKVEILEIFKTLLFSVKFKQEVFFQHLDFGVLNEYLTRENLLECIKTVEESGGSLLKMKNFELKFLRDVHICTSHVKDEQYAKCEKCQDTPPILSRHDAIKHKLQCHPTMESPKLSPLERILSLKDLDPGPIMDIVRSCKTKRKCCVYAIGAVPCHDTNHTVLDAMRSTKGCQLYFGQNSAGDVSPYHFSTTTKSSVRNMKTKDNRIFLVRKWFCETTRDMYRLESALIIMGHLRRLLKTGEDNKDYLTIVNKIVQLYDIAEKFSVDEFQSLYECAVGSDCMLLDIELPEFLKFTAVVDYEEELTDEITGLNVE